MVQRNDAAATTTAVYVVVLAVAVLMGTVLAPVVWNATQPTADDEEESVAVVTLRGGTSPANVNQVTEDLRDARANESIAATVLRIDSSGGAVQSSEELYLAVNRTAREMPVVAYVEGTAASGGYYGIVPADEIVVKPSSTVGSIGVVVQAPLSQVEEERRTREAFLRTGPDKAMITKDSIRTQMETLHNAFLDSVMHHRSDELALDRRAVSNGAAYLGPVAVENGFADRTGDLGAAVEAAAERADGIDGGDYDVVYDEPVTPPTDGLGLDLRDAERVDGDLIVVDRSESGAGQFEEPVRYYAVWGVPSADGPTEVSANASD